MGQSANTFQSLNSHFKEVYADSINDLVPDGTRLLKMVKFIESERRPGNLYHQPVTLTDEHGFTYGGTNGGAYRLNTAIANNNADAQIQGHSMVLRSIIDMDSISRSMNGKAAFVRETSWKIENMLKSFSRRLEVQMMYGQSGIGIVKSTSGTIITIETEEWAPGIWSGSEDMSIEIYSSAGIKRGSATVSAVSMANKTVTVDALPAGVVATDVIYHLGSYGKEFAGLHKIITNSSGTLFGIDAATYSLWRGNTVNVGTDFAGSEAVLSFGKVEEAIAVAMEKGLADEDVVVICNPRSWKNLLTEQAAKRVYDDSYKNSEMINGAKVVKFYGENGLIEVMSSIYCKEGYAYVICPKFFKRVGSSDVTLGFNDAELGAVGRFIRLMEEVNGYEIRAYCDQALFCSRPGINTVLQYIKS